MKNAPELESINGTNYFRVYSEYQFRHIWHNNFEILLTLFVGKISDDKPWFDGRSDVRHIHCVRPATCEKLTLDDCLGSKIPYTHTGLNLTHRITQNEIKNDLIRFEALKYVPRCWAVVQVILFLFLILNKLYRNMNSINHIHLLPLIYFLYEYSIESTTRLMLEKLLKSHYSLLFALFMYPNAKK